MKWLIVLGAWMMGGWTAAGQSFDASAIPAVLRAGAKAIVREDRTIVEVKNLGEVLVTRHKVITILNPAGKSLGFLVLNYDKSRPVTDISGKLYDANGREIRRFRKNDFEDVSTSHDFSLFEDDRVKRIFPASAVYPYTVSYDYTQKYKFTLFLPNWFPVEADGIAVEKSLFSVTIPQDMHLRFYENKAGSPEMDSSGKSVTYRWRLRALAAFPPEPLMPPILKSDVPVVVLSPERFEYYGMKGRFSNWEQLGSWISQHFLAGKDELPIATQKRIRAMTASATSSKEAARRIYAYVQHKTRYISIQVGKGGLIPMKAADVDRVGYGDCKALVNYTMALMKVAGISAYYTLVYGGDDKTSMLADFASAGQGDHIILCVPFGKDTTWLECTDKTIPFGFLGSFTDDRDVVVCTPQGGFVTHTPRYADTLNQVNRRASFTLDKAGGLRGRMITSFTGLSYERREGFETLGVPEKIRRAQSAYGFLQMDVDTLKLAFKKTALPVATEYLCFSSPLYAAPNANGMSVPLNPVARLKNVPGPVHHRVNDVVVMRGYETADSIYFTLPEGTRISLLPAPVHLHNAFGDYETELHSQKDQLTYIRHFRLRSGRYSADSYEKLVTFLSQVSGYDKGSFILTN